MLTLLTYTPETTIRQQMLDGIRQAFAHYSAEDLRCLEAAGTAAALAYLQAEDVQLLCWDVRDAASCTALEQARQLAKQAFLVVLADSSTSPLAFLKPAISPNSLVFCSPLHETEIDRVAHEMLAEIQLRAEDQSQFTIVRRDEQLQIPYNRIYYFEARERHLLARLRNEEIGFTGTLEQLEQALPPPFQRVHRAYLVNMQKVEKILFTENFIQLRDGIGVPLSRSYKKSLRGKAHG